MGTTLRKMFNRRTIYLILVLVVFGLMRVFIFHA